MSFGKMFGAALGEAGTRFGNWAGTGQGMATLGGAAAGGIFGGVSDESSFVGGAMAGAGLGAFGARTYKGGMAGMGSGTIGALAGAGLGGAWGALSPDTSFLGGMASGALLGAGAGRMGTAAWKGGAAGEGFGGMAAGAGKGAWGVAKLDSNMALNRVSSKMAGAGRFMGRAAEGTSMAANKGYGKVASSLKSWGEKGMGVNYGGI